MIVNMKQMKIETENVIAKQKQANPMPPPPPPPPLPRFWARKSAADSVTNREIAKFWRQKRVEEEDHLLAAIKAAARIRARNLSEEEYKRFEESLDEDDNTKEKITAPANSSKGDEKNDEIRVGIKDWWTKSKYAYLNQPAVESTDNSKRRASTYIPNFFNFKPAPLYPTSLGVF